MRKIFSCVLLVSLVLSQFQVLQIYAAEQSELASEKVEAIATIETVDSLIDSTVEKLDNKITD